MEVIKKFITSTAIAYDMVEDDVRRIVDKVNTGDELTEELEYFVANRARNN